MAYEEARESQTPTYEDLEAQAEAFMKAQSAIETGESEGKDKESPLLLFLCFCPFSSIFSFFLFPRFSHQRSPFLFLIIFGATS